MRSLKIGLIAAVLLAATPSFADDILDQWGLFSKSTLELYWPESQVIKFCGSPDLTNGCLTAPQITPADFAYSATSDEQLVEVLPTSITTNQFSIFPDDWPMDGDFSDGPTSEPYTSYL